MLQNKKIMFLFITAAVLGLNTTALLADDTGSSNVNQYDWRQRLTDSNSKAKKQDNPLDQYDWRQKLVSEDGNKKLGDSFLEAFGMNSDAAGNTGKGGPGTGGTSVGSSAGSMAAGAAVVIDNSISHVTTTTPYSY